jgi:hypothetical protein
MSHPFLLPRPSLHSCGRGLSSLFSVRPLSAHIYLHVHTTPILLSSSISQLRWLLAIVACASANEQQERRSLKRARLRMRMQLRALDLMPCLLSSYVVLIVLQLYMFHLGADPLELRTPLLQLRLLVRPPIRCRCHFSAARPPASGSPHFNCPAATDSSTSTSTTTQSSSTPSRP